MLLSPKAVAETREQPPSATATKCPPTEFSQPVTDPTPPQRLGREGEGEGGEEGHLWWPLPPNKVGAANGTVTPVATKPLFHLRCLLPSPLPSLLVATQPRLLFAAQPRRREIVFTFGAPPSLPPVGSVTSMGVQPTVTNVHLWCLLPRASCGTHDIYS